MPQSSLYRHRGFDCAQFTVASGCFEIRLKGPDGVYRAFCMIKVEIGILVFHSFKKKSQKTPIKEIETGRRRLSAFLKELSLEKK